MRLAFLVDGQPAVCFELHDVTAPPAGDLAGFQARVPPGTRLVEGAGPVSHLDIPAPVQAAWKAGLAGASGVAGWLQSRLDKPGDQAD